VKLNEKSVNFIMDKEEHRQLKNYCVKRDISIKEVILRSLRKEGIIKNG